MVRVIEVRRKRFKSEKLLDKIHGREPQEECDMLLTLEDAAEHRTPTEADIEAQDGTSPSGEKET